MRVSSDRLTDQAAALKPPTSSFELRASSPLDGWLALLVGLAGFVLYLRTLAPGLLWGDSGEFQFAAWLGGFAHPTGYPLYLMLGWLWTHGLPWGDPAWRMNLFSALWAAVAVGLVYLLVVRSLRLFDDVTSQPGMQSFHRLGALCAAAILAVTPTFWSQATVAEVYTLHAVFVAAAFLGLLVWAARPAGARARVLYGVALLCGLSLTHHRTTLLLLPAMAAFLWLARPRIGAMPPASFPTPMLPARRNVLIALTLLLAPLLLYLYIPLRASQAPYFQLTLGPDQVLPLYRTTLVGFLEHISGSTFSSELGGGGDLGPALVGLIQRFAQELSWPGVILGLSGVGWLGWLTIRSCVPEMKRSRLAWLVLTLAAFVTTVGFNLLYGIGDIFVFYIPAYLIWALWIGAGVWGWGRVVIWLCQRIPPLTSVLALTLALFGSLSLLLPGFLAVRSFAANDRSGDVSARAVWEAILAQPVPQNAILVSNDRDEMVPQWYLKYVEDQRTDLDGLFPLIQPGPAWSNVVRVTEQALASGRPVLLVKPMPGLAVKFGLAPTSASSVEPLGALVGVHEAAADVPLRSVVGDYADSLRLTGCHVQPAMIAAGEEMTVTLVWEPQRVLAADYVSFVHVVNADGVVVGQSDHLPGGVYYPTSLWQPGERLQDVHSIQLAPALGRPPYELRVGLYTTADGELELLGEPQRAGYVGLRRQPDVLPADLTQRRSVTFYRQIVLLGYEPVVRADALAVRFYWQALRPPNGDYTLFVHLLDAGGQIVAQNDQPPGGAELPTSAWPAGFVLRGDIEVVAPPDLAAGTYRLIVGLYDPGTGVRLPATSEGGVPLGDSLLLGAWDWPVQP